jgi:hypothetical protein
VQRSEISRPIEHFLAECPLQEAGTQHYGFLLTPPVDLIVSSAPRSHRTPLQAQNHQVNRGIHGYRTKVTSRITRYNKSMERYFVMDNVFLVSFMLANPDFRRKGHSP